MKAARSFHWWNAHPRRTTRLQQRELDADRLWRVTMRHWARRRWVADWRDIGKPWPFRRVTQ